MFEQAPPLEVLQEALNDPQHPIGMRMRAAYYLRRLHEQHREDDIIDDKTSTVDDGVIRMLRSAVIEALSNGLLNEKHGSLMRHEFAYVMGQIRDTACVGVLEKVLQNDSDCVMVRHEAAEALGAIGALQSKDVLRTIMLKYQHSAPELSDTCRLALNVMEWRDNGEATGGNVDSEPLGCACMTSPYSSVDPAPPNPLHENLSFQDLGNILCDPERDIFERYRAMFSLRNRGSEAAVQQLCRALTQDSSSALLRHEVAYVLGQMQHPSSVEALEESLRKVNEHKMVRHEAAEALGAIDGRWMDVERILTEFASDSNDVVRESCLVALDAADYWGHNQQTDKDNDNSGDESAVLSDAPDRCGFAHQKASMVAKHFNIKH